MTIASYFSPHGGCQAAVVRELEAAQGEILVQAYSFTADPITLALLEAHRRHVQVLILLDRSNEVDRWSDLQMLQRAGLTVRIDAAHAIAHNKVMIVDRKTVITGSYNFTNQAEKSNAENLLVIRDHPDLIESYWQNWHAHEAHCRPPQKPTVAAAAKAA